MCGRPLVIGVLNRVAELADRPSTYRPENAVGFKKIVELDKIIAEALNIKNRNSVRVQKQYQEIINRFGNELFILLDLDLTKIDFQTDLKVDSRDNFQINHKNNHKTVIDVLSRIIKGIEKMRIGKLIVKPGYDGEYGIINIFND